MYMYICMYIYFLSPVLNVYSNTPIYKYIYIYICVCVCVCVYVCVCMCLSVSKLPIDR